jgi:four helix bundle protein
MVNFAVEVIKFADRLPRNQVGRHLANQLLRSGTSPEAHYAEARGAESANDFIHKLKVCLKELNEAQVWLKIIARTGMKIEADLNSVIQECNELSRIINASIRTARQKAQNRRPN